MASNPRNQAEAAMFMKQREEELLDKKLFESESEALEFLNWAELPMTKKIREKFKQTKGKFQDHFESQKWKDEAEARGIAYSMRFLGILEKLVESYRDLYDRVQIRKQQKQKEG